MNPAIASLIDRAGLDRAKVRQLIGRGLSGADDGELFLEYRQSEVLVFDNNRLKLKLGTNNLICQSQQFRYFKTSIEGNYNSKCSL